MEIPVFWMVAQTSKMKNAAESKKASKIVFFFIRLDLGQASVELGPFLSL
jgi:hypothetical protein